MLGQTSALKVSSIKTFRNLFGEQSVTGYKFQLMNTKITFPVVGCIALASFSLVTNARAGGVGGVVAAGSATISGMGSAALNINQTTTRAVIDWSSFNLGSDESAVFH